MTLQQWVEEYGYRPSENGPDAFIVELDHECDEDVFELMQALEDYEVEREWESSGGTSYRLVKR